MDPRTGVPTPCQRDGCPRDRDGLDRYRRLRVVADALLEALVVPSFSRVGCESRARLWDWPPPPAMEGQVALVTGASSGIGLATARALAALGAKVHLVCRDPGRCERAAAVVARAGEEGGRGGGVAGTDLADLGDPGAARMLGSALSHRYPGVQALVHCAGSLSPRFETGPGGTEITVAVHVLAPHVLTALLAENLRAGSGRVVVVSSGGMYTQRFDLGTLVMDAHTYRGSQAYARAKRAQVVLAHAWRHNLGPLGIGAFAMHPGWVDTPGLEKGMPRFYRLARPFLRNASEGAGTAVWLAAGGAPPAWWAPGGPVFFHDRAPRTEHRGFPDGLYQGRGHPAPRAADPASEGDELLDWCEQRTGVNLGRAGL